MNMSELEAMPAIELKRLRSDIDAALAKRQAHDVNEARAKCLAIAADVGVPIAELIGLNGKHVNERKQSKPVVAKFRNPDNATQNWTGRGRQPQWVSDMVAKDGNYERARIASSGVTGQGAAQ